MRKKDGLSLSFWRLGEEARLRHVWRPIAQQLNAVRLFHAKKATRALIVTGDAIYQYSLSTTETIPKMFKDISFEDVWRTTTYPGRLTVVTITIYPAFLEDGERFVLRNPYALVRGYREAVCISTLTGGTVAALRQGIATPLRINDLRIVREGEGGRSRPGNTGYTDWSRTHKAL